MDGHERTVLTVGEPVPGWTPRPRPPRTPMVGRYCRVEPLDADRHADQLYQAMANDAGRRNWTYLLTELPDDVAGYRAWVAERQTSDDPQFFAIVDAATGQATGIASYLRIDPNNGVIEVGHINFTPRLQQTRAATEAMYLMMQRVFGELGYRRYEWKCDSLNQASRRAAARYGFQFEGVFRQALVYKNRNRDSAWFAIIDKDWPVAETAFQRWLQPGNFDADGRQIQSLAACFANGRDY